MGRDNPVAVFEGDAMDAEDLKKIDIFADVKEDRIRQFPGTVRRREFDPGEVICLQGEGGTTAFYIVEGEARIFIKRAKDSGGRSGGGLMAFIGSLFGQKKARSTPDHEAGKVVTIDASVDLDYGSLAATIGPGNLFGEMSCLNLAPRSATVVAQTRCVMLEILRNMYGELEKGKTFKERQDKLYKDRALSNHLRGSPLLEGVPDETIARLKDVAELVSFDPGKPVFAEGDKSDAMYLVRRGQVRISKKFPGGERGLAYLTKGDVFGEMGMVRGTPRSASATAADHPVVEGAGRTRRSAKVELVKIKTEDFDRVLAGYPEVRARLVKIAEQRDAEQSESKARITPSVYSQEVENLGLLQGQNLMLIDLEKCTRCDQCAKACGEAHDDGLSRLIREGPRFDKYLVPSSCRMCMDPVCMIGCPVASIRKAKDLNIVIEDWCIACGVCAKQCPYNSIQVRPLTDFATHAHGGEKFGDKGEVTEVTDRAVVCDQCSTLPTGPACVYACPHDAALRVNGMEFLSARSKVSERAFDDEGPGVNYT
ncbi:MAG: cyclic nucleotide-binding domain-containing protein [Planctomycetes bacterium]|nr:cyclic nucleotide-binding domain-containing protein [Planctomycetota bacterium]